MSESRNQIESVINIPQMVDGSQVLFNLIKTSKAVLARSKRRIIKVMSILFNTLVVTHDSQ
jgi:hypothetical protein